MTDISWLGPAIDVRPLLAEQQAAFIDLLRGLETDEWAQPTICPRWNVKDVAAHVLGDHIGHLSIHRDAFRALHSRDCEPFPIYLDRINDEWVSAARRISPPMLIELLSTIGDEIVQFWQTVDLDAIGGPVRWAGPEAHPFWLGRSSGRRQVRSVRSVLARPRRSSAGRAAMIAVSDIERVRDCTFDVRNSDHAAPCRAASLR